MPRKPPANDVTNRALQWHDMSRPEQRTADRLMREHGATMPQQLQAKSESLARQATKGGPGAKAKAAGAARTAAAAAAIPGGLDLTRREAAGRRVAAMTTAATTHRIPGEAMGGAGWYFDAARRLADVGGDLPMETRVHASSALSPGATPETERASFGALADAHGHPEASIHFTPELVNALHSAKGGSKAQVPPELHGQRVGINQVPTKVIGALAQGTHSDVAERHSQGVDWAGVRSSPKPGGISKASGIIRGEGLPSPKSNPKTYSYGQSIESAHEALDTPVQEEYMLRAHHIGRTLRNEVPVGQGMLDLFGERHNNEGILSPSHPTAEDSWQRAISSGHPDRQLRKAVGDIALPRKTHERTTRSGETVKESASSIPGVGGDAIHHAWENKATQMAGEQLRDELKLGFEVPSVLVQETGWAGLRRDSPPLKMKPDSPLGADKEYNAHIRATQEAVKPPRAPRQPTLFSDRRRGA